MNSGKRKGLFAGLAVGGILIIIGGYISMNMGLDTLREIRPKQYLTFRAGSESQFDQDQYAKAFREAQDIETCWKETEDYLERYPNSRLAMANKAYLLISDGQYEEGILLNQKVLAMHGADSSVYNNLGWAYVTLGQYDLAIYYLEAAINVNSGEPTYFELVNLGDAYQGLEQYEQAVAYYQQANRDFQEDARTAPYHGLHGLAETYQVMEQYEDALKIYDRILKLDPANYAAFISSMILYQEMGAADRLVMFGEAFLEHNPEEIYAYSSIAYSLYELKQYERAAEYYIRYAESSEDPAYGYYYAAEAYVLAGDHEQARQYMDRCLECDPSYSVYLADEELWGWLND